MATISVTTLFLITIAAREFAEGELSLQILYKQVESMTQFLDQPQRKFAIDQKDRTKNTPRNDRTTYQGSYTDCNQIYDAGFHKSGIYQVRLFHGLKTIPVLCDMRTNGTFTRKRGWIVIQQRRNGEVNFDRGWKDYMEGFGIPGKEHWIGLKNLWHLLRQKHIEEADHVKKPVLRMDFQDWDGVTAHVEYDSFNIASSEFDYAITSLGKRHSPKRFSPLSFNYLSPFSTYDHNNDPERSESCQNIQKGGWWFSSCSFSNLNGFYSTDKGPMRRNQMFVAYWSRVNPNNTAYKHVSMKLQWY